MNKHLPLAPIFAILLLIILLCKVFELIDTRINNTNLWPAQTIQEIPSEYPKIISNSYKIRYIWAESDLIKEDK